MKQIMVLLLGINLIFCSCSQRKSNTPESLADQIANPSADGKLQSDSLHTKYSMAPFSYKNSDNMVIEVSQAEMSTSTAVSREDLLAAAKNEGVLPGYKNTDSVISILVLATLLICGGYLYTLRRRHNKLKDRFDDLVVG